MKSPLCIIPTDTQASVFVVHFIAFMFTVAVIGVGLSFVEHSYRSVVVTIIRPYGREFETLPMAGPF